MAFARAVALVVGSGALVVVACHKVPYTERQQYNVIPNAVMTSIGKSSYAEALQGAPVARRGEDAATLERVGQRIAKAANEPSYDWEYALVQDPTVNAWCMPGGKIAFYTGILPVVSNEAGMAFVMGHEVGHATAHHGAERLSQQLTVLGGLTGLELFLTDRTQLSASQRATVLAALGAGAEVGVLLPFSRTQESEADVIGLMYMAKAGYPPAQSIDVWDRMEALAPSDTPVFLSTHPTNAHRKENLREWLPEARKKYDRNKHPGDDPVAPLWTGRQGGDVAGR
jgi:predicted Zn-dependent protease